MELTCNLQQTPASKLLLRFIALELSTRGRRLLRRVGVARPRPLDLDTWGIPDSALARQATDLAQAVSPTCLFNHCLRTYAFGLAIGQHHGVSCDRELLYVAAVLHDLGLTEAYDGPEPFELLGARAAHRFCTERGLDRDKADLVHEAIALHTSVGVANKREPEIALLHLGAGMDVAGLRAEDLAPQTVAHILAAWPRLDLKQHLYERFVYEAERKPHTDLAKQMSLGFGRKILQAPFD